MSSSSATTLPSLDGRIALVTGANAGLGYLTSLELARAGAHVLLASRSVEKGKDAAARIRDEVPAASLDVVQLDLASLDATRAAARAVSALTNRLDILVNNAGVVSLPEYGKTVDGHEMHMGVNHFGHHVLTHGLWDLLLAADEPRIVTLTSGGYRFADLRFDDLAWEHRPYKPVAAYGTSKLANLYFTRGLQRRLDAAGSWGFSVAAHPGLTGTERQQTTGMGGLFSRVAASDPTEGVQPQLLAATSLDVQPGALYGPRFGMRGAPQLQKVELDDLVEQRVWRVTEAVTGARW